MEDYTRTDLACESGKADGGTTVREEDVDGFHLIRLLIRQGDEERILRKPAGNYTTVVCGRIWELEADDVQRLTALLAKEIRTFAKRMTQKAPGSDLRVLVAGLGNPDITPDAVGPETVRRVTVTRPISSFDRGLFESIGCAEVSAFSPGVFGQTGLESVDLLCGAVEHTAPDLLVAVDALAARSCERLAATVQLSDCGISPGSGIGNCRRAVNRQTTGVPVLSVGVPTVVDSATLVYDALEKAGIHEIDPPLRQVLENGRRFYVSPKESDKITECVAELLAGAIDAAFVGENTGGFCGI